MRKEWEGGSRRASHPAEETAPQELILVERVVMNKVPTGCQGESGGQVRLLRAGHAEPRGEARRPFLAGHTA